MSGYGWLLPPLPWSASASRRAEPEPYSPCSLSWRWGCRWSDYLTTANGHLLVTLRQAPALAAVDLTLSVIGVICAWRAIKTPVQQVADTANAEDAVEQELPA